MRVLVFGGTGFVGRHLASTCLAQGHTVTLFHRGRSDAAVFPEAEHILGDRERAEDLAQLGGREWDVAFDTSGYEVRAVRAAARAARAARWTFVSSISVYSDFANTDEAAGPLRAAQDPERLPLSLASYGALKAACERAVSEEHPARTLVVRPGLILGPHDYDQRFRYWLTRVARGGDVLAPGDPSARVQFIDVRDLTEWMLRAAESRVTGVRNAVGPGEPVTMRDLLETIRDVTKSDARFTWVPDEVLLGHGVAPYSEMPFWLPATLGAKPVPNARAIAEGLVHRPHRETVQDTWTWMQDGWEPDAPNRANRALKVPAGITPAREAQILAGAR